MKTVLTLLSLALFCTGALAQTGNGAQGTGYACVAPAFPEMSVSNAAVHRLELQVRAWRTCYDRLNASERTPEVVSQQAALMAAMEKWLAATRTYNNGRFVSERALAWFERQREAYLLGQNQDTNRVFRAGSLR